MLDPSIPRVTLEEITSQIVAEHYFTARDGVVGTAHDNPTEWKPVWQRSYADDVRAQFSGEHDVVSLDIASLSGHVNDLKRITFCLLVFRNGFAVVGQSACVSIELYDAEVGRVLAREDALSKCWELFGFHLASTLHE